MEGLPARVSPYLVSMRPWKVPFEAVPLHLNSSWHGEVARLHPLTSLTGFLKDIVGRGRVRSKREGSVGSIITDWCLGVDTDRSPNCVMQ